MKNILPVGAAAVLAFFALPLGAQQPTQQPAPSPAAAPADDLARFKTADELWAYIQKLQPEKQPETRADIVAFFRRMQAALDVFIARFPQDPRRFEAKLSRVELENRIANINGAEPDLKAVEAVCAEVLADPGASADIRRQARFFLLSTRLRFGVDEKLQADIAAFSKEYPKDARGDVDLLNLLLGKSLVSTDPAKAEALLSDAAKSGNEEIAATAKSELVLVQLRGKPLDLKFKAMDGTAVDVAKLRGKVVLVDFWATWCQPCMMEMPHVVEAYQKLHAKGFEIIGISLDMDAKAVKRATKAAGVTWPQYFDGKGWQNEISSKYGITSIPAMWLLNKKGELVNTDPAENLQEAVEKLLAE